MDKYSGKPTGVVTNADGWTAEQMQKIVRKLKNSETASILSPDADSLVLLTNFLIVTSTNYKKTQLLKIKY